ncbi:MAG: hypothetical protein ABL921_25270 [Pirellula sp.]
MNVQDEQTPISKVETLIKDVYQHPDMYGLTAFELEATLFTLHAVLAQIANRGREFSDGIATATNDEERQYGGYVRGYLKDYFPGGQQITEKALKEHVIARFRLVSKAMGINL